VLKSTAVRNREGRAILAVNVIEDVTAAKRGEFAQRLLARAGAVLASSLEYERTLQQVAELAVPELADWCGVSLPDRTGMLRQVAVAHVDPEKVRFAREMDERYPVSVDDPSGAAQVLREGVSQCVNEIPDELLRASAADEEQYELLRGVGMRAALIVPLMVGGRAIGTLALVSAESGRTFSEGDVALAEELARRAGTAVENARLYTERSNIADTLQTGLLPTPLPDMPGWATAELYRPAGEENWVGGDFYDAFPVTGGWMVVVGDVAGRGAAAAALTALARHTVRAVAQVLPSPLEAVARLNAELYARPGNALCTLAVAVLRDDGAAEILCAGHPQPFLLRDGSARAVGHFGPMVGALAGARWETETVPLEPGDCLILYTDGVIDAVGERDRFGEQRLQETLAGADSAGEAIERIEQALAAFEHGPQADDTAALAVCRLAAPAGSPPPAAEPPGAASGYPS
jgi:serine phosphatase RsbU (regulator of sigma subunit)